MTVKTDWALRFYSEVLGLEYLHYGLWDGEPVTVAGLREAQQRYADTLIAMIPQGAKRVLDVGCGTGAVAARLRAGGFEVEALSPDPYHQQVVRERHGDLTFHLSRFEDYSGAGDFDVVLMSESSQYIALDILFEAARRAAPNGHLLVADYFNFSRDGGVVTRSGHLLDEFLAAAEGAGYAIDERRDITDAAAPTLDLGRSLADNHLLPGLNLARDLIHDRYHWIYRLGRRWAGAKLEKLETSRPLLDTDEFRKWKRYEMILFRRAAPEQ